MAAVGTEVLRKALKRGANPEVWIRFPRQLGDLMFSLPFVNTLQMEWNRAAREEGATLRWIAVGHDIGASLFAETDPAFISESRIESRGEGKQDPMALARLWRKQPPVAVVNLSQSVRLGLAAWLARVPIRAGDNDNHLRFLYHHTFNYRTPGKHLANRFEDLLEPLTGLRTMQLLPVTPERFGGSSGMDLLRELGWNGEPYIALAFGTRVDIKRWFPEEEKWPELARIFMDRGYRIVWLGGPDEAPLGARLAERVPGSLNATGRTTIPEASAIQYHAFGSVTVDTGLAHTSAATGRPTLAIFGPTFDAACGPQGPHALVLRPPVVDVDPDPHPGQGSCNGSHRLSAQRVARLFFSLAEEAPAQAARPSA